MALTNQINVFKIGGKIVNDKILLKTFLDQLCEIEGDKIIVHGGGNKASQVLKDLGITSNMVQGRRITNLATLEVVIMVYGGLLNKNMVALMQAKGINAIGLSGADGNIIRSNIRPVKEIDYGYVGDIIEVNDKSLIDLCNAGLVPVICALTHDKKGQILNTNADTIASAISGALSKQAEVNLKFCFELSGVMKDINDDGSLIKHLKESEVKSLRNDGIINDGMIPKLKNGYDALHNGVKNVSICHVREMNIAEAGTKLML